MADIPQLKLPLRVVNGQFAVTEQGSVDDVVSQALALVVTEPGWLTLDDEVRRFGLADQAHAEQVDVGLIERQIAEHVPDADALVDEERDALNPALSLLGVRVGLAD